MESISLHWFWVYRSKLSASTLFFMSNKSIHHLPWFNKNFLDTACHITFVKLDTALHIIYCIATQSSLPLLVSTNMSIRSAKRLVHILAPVVISNWHKASQKIKRVHDHLENLVVVCFFRRTEIRPGLGEQLKKGSPFFNIFSFI